MHWITRENITEKLRAEVADTQNKLQALLERTVRETPDNTVEIFRARSALEARLNITKEKLEIWLDVPREFESSL
jgi:hypothetical protein